MMRVKVKKLDNKRKVKRFEEIENKERGKKAREILYTKVTPNVQCKK